MSENSDIYTKVAARYQAAGVPTENIEIKTYPGEIVVLVTVSSDLERAIEIANELDEKIEKGFISVRKSAPKNIPLSEPVDNVHDSKLTLLVELMSARSRTSLTQPSLRYIPDASDRIGIATSPRHHLVFGRRGVGKTALLLETRRMVSTAGSRTVWVNMQSLRELGAYGAFLEVAARVCELAQSLGSSVSSSYRSMSALREEITEEQTRHQNEHIHSPGIVPRMQRALGLYCDEVQCPVFLFIDDLHYLKHNDVPKFLDLLHGITRDNPVWLKIAAIRHQTRWFLSNPPTGLQTGHDVAIIDLDITLENPRRAKEFLLNILYAYMEECSVRPLSRFISSSATDRLVLASGGVPRDFMMLSASAIQTARQRSHARATGVQDVNTAAGLAAQPKIQELEDDAAAAVGEAQQLLDALQQVRDYLLTDQRITFFRVDFYDKERRPEEYSLIQKLMDLRMIHLINSSLSSEREAGRRSEVYVLDLSQYSGSRLRQNVRVLDFHRDHLLVKRSGTTESPQRGDSPLRLVAILRRGPELSLTSLHELVGGKREHRE